jgi:hypothetical protein
VARLELGARFRGPIVGVLVLLLVGVAGCKGSKKATSSTATTSTTSSTATASTASPGAAQGPLTLARCRTATLSITATTEGAVGHSGLLLHFQNQADRPCVMQGYPGVALLDSNGHHVTDAVRTPFGFLGGLAPDRSAPPVVTLGKGQEASSIVEGTAVPVGTARSCVSYAGVLVTPPGETAPRELSESVPGCSTVAVHPVVPGVYARLPA